MGIVRKFDQHKYNLPVEGSGVADFASQNKETLKDVGKAVSSVSDAVGNTSKAVHAAKRFNELRELQQIKDKQNKLPVNVVNELKAASKKGDGFEKF